MKSSRIISIIAISVFLFSSVAGCTKDAASLNNQNNISQNSTLSKKNSDKQETSSISSDKSDSRINDEIIRERAQCKELLSKITDNAKSGKVINSSFAVEANNMTDVEEKFGPSRETDYVAAAKGSYANYPDYSLVFGFNKGGRIFEVRSFDSSLKLIALSSLKNILGKPDHYVKTKSEQIIGYTVNDKYKLLFVFDNGSDESTLVLKHYSVLYPQGTANSMANDPGRQW